MFSALLILTSVTFAAEKSSKKDKQITVPVAGLTAAELATAPAFKRQRDQLLAQRFFDHFTFGQDAPDAWFGETLKQNGAKWDCRVSYLSHVYDGAEDPWFLKYGALKSMLAESQKGGYVMWCTVYGLSEAPPARYQPNPPEACVANIKVPETMRGYFTNVKRIFQQVAEIAPYPVVVHFEPDEWTHMLLSGGMDPEKVDIKVGSCGLEDLVGLPDNELGYARALKLLRDRYAPANALIACNPSAWDSGGSMTGAKMGEIFKRMCGDYDLAAFEFGDRDKGASSPKLPHGSVTTDFPFGDQSGMCGTFERHIAWTENFTKTSGLYVCMWQVACGNATFATCDNTPGHHTDNLFESIFDGYPKESRFIAKYIQAGCIGWMANAGQGFSPHVSDAKKDGITNPTPISGNKGLKSEYADDDGGYARLKGGIYYQKPAPLRTPGLLAKLAELGAPVKPLAKEKPKSEPKPVEKPIAYILADPGVLVTWDGTLQARMRDELKSKKSLGFTSSAMKSPVLVSGLSATGDLDTSMPGMGSIVMAWKTLDPRDKASIAVSMRKDFDPQDNALCAFYLRLIGDEFKATAALDKAGAAGDAVKAAFRLPSAP